MRGEALTVPKLPLMMTVALMTHYMTAGKTVRLRASCLLALGPSTVCLEDSPTDRNRAAQAGASMEC